MVIEHAFVSIIEPTAAMKQAADYLSARDFTLAPGTGAAFALDAQSQTWSSLEMSRGRKRARSAKNVSQLPQRLRIDWDRGKIGVAMSIVPSTTWGGGGSFSIGRSEGNPKKMVLHTRLLNAIETGLERLLAYNGSKQADYSEWDAIEKEITKAARRRLIRIWTIFFFIVAVIGGLIALAVVNGK